MNKRVITFLTASLFVTLLLTSALFAGDDENPCGMTKSLYERLGGVNAISMVVDEFVEILYVNEILNANPAIDKARKNIPMPALKFKVTGLICQVTGGPQAYTGRSMKEAHAHLNITEVEWAAMAADFKTVLDKFGVPEKEQAELFEIVGTTKADIVMPAGDGDGGDDGDSDGDGDGDSK